MAARNATRARDHADRAAPRHSRTAAGDRREHGANAPRDRRSDRSTGRAQSNRRPPWPVARCRGAGAARGRAAVRRGRRTRPSPAGLRADIAAPPQAPATRDITGAPARRNTPPNFSPVQGGKDENASAQWRLAVRPAHARVARRQPADCPARRPRAAAQRGASTARQHRIDRYAFGRHRADDRPRCGCGVVGTL